MKEITINNRNYYYKVVADGEFTKFYKKETKQVKEFIFFGKLVDDYTHQFSFDGDVDNLTAKRKEALKVREQNFYNMINNIKLEI
jgi:hypothetical protein